MLLASEVLAQGENMVCLDEYQICDNELLAKPKFDGLMGHDMIPVSLWIEAICQNGELLCRSKTVDLKQMMLTNVSEICIRDLRKLDTRDIWFRTKETAQMQHYFKSEISVIKGREVLFVCNCTHYIQ